MAQVSNTKVFLSHSSKDKEYVERVYSYLGPDRAFIDRFEINDGEDIKVEILKGVKECGIFCLFISRNVISNKTILSKWIEAEVSQARNAEEETSQKTILLYIIDDLKIQECPKWMTNLNIRSVRDPELVSKRIRRALLEKASDHPQERMHFVGRQEEIQRLNKIHALPPAEQPRAVFIYGWEGMGRNRLIQHSVGENSIARVNLKEASSSIDLYRELKILLEKPSAQILAEHEAIFQSLTSHQQSSEVAKKIDDILNQKFHLQINEANCLFLDDRTLVPWFSEILSLLKKTSPYCVFIRTRRRPKNRSPRFSIDDVRLQDLSPADMENLLGRLLNESSINFTSEKLRQAVEEIGGHPFSAYRFAGYAKGYGMDAALNNKAIMIEYRELLLADALDDFKFNKNEFKILFVTSRFRIIDITALSEYTLLTVHDILPALERLIDTGMIVHSGDLYSIAPFVRAPLERHKMWNLDEEWTSGVDERAARAGESFIDDGVGSSALLEVGIAANLRLGNRTQSPLANLVLGSHLFRVAREVYDANKTKKALELYAEALRLKATLTSEAISEALRMYGLCGVRLEKEDIIDSAISQLNALNSQSAKRNAAFLRGFRYRRSRRYRDALPQFEESLRHGDHPHTLREASVCALKLGNLSQARAWASAAVKTAPSNPYFLDALCGVVLAELLAARNFDREHEFEALMSRLARACSSTRDSFFELRRLEQGVAVKNVSEIKIYATKLLRSVRHDDVICAAIALALFAEEDQSITIRDLENKYENLNSRRRMDVSALKCIQALNDRRIDDAVSWLLRDNESWELDAVRIDYKAIHDKVVLRARSALANKEYLKPESVRFISRAR